MEAWEASGSVTSDHSLGEVLSTWKLNSSPGFDLTLTSSVFPQTATSCWPMHRAHGAFPSSTALTASASSRATAALRSCRKHVAAISFMVQRPVSQPCRGYTRHWRAIRNTRLKFASTGRMVRAHPAPLSSPQALLRVQFAQWKPGCWSPHCHKLTM